jgi:maleylpyruvate isomerase
VLGGQADLAAPAPGQLSDPGRPAADLAQVARAQARFEAALEGLDDAAARVPSALPGWSVGHLLTHVARNADSHTRRAEAAGRGETVGQYAGGFEGRAAEIEAGAGRPAAALVADVQTSAARAMAAWEAVADPAWAVVSLDVGGRSRTLASLPARRWQELEVHLGLGATPDDWSEEFVARFLPLVRASVPGRLPPGAAAPAPGSLAPAHELAWAYGRLTRPGLPVLAPWR